MWYRITGPKGFDSDAVLPYRTRLIVCYLYKEDGKTSKGIGEAYVDNGKWYWWDNTDTNSRVEINNLYQLVAWTLFPQDVFL